MSIRQYGNQWEQGDNGSRGMGSKCYGTKITGAGGWVLSGMEQR